MSVWVVEAGNQIGHVEDEVCKAGLRILLEMTQDITHIETSPGWITVEGEKIQK